MNNQTLKIRSEFDVVNARMLVREMARKLGMNLGDQARISLATSSLAHDLGLGGAKQGHIAMAYICREERQGVQVICIERNGTSPLDAPVSFGDSRWMVDEFSAERLPTNDLQVTLVKWLV